MGKRLARQPSLRTLAQVGCKFDPWISSLLSTGIVQRCLKSTGCFHVPPMAGWLYSTCTYIYIYLSVYTHVYVFVHIFIQEEAWPFCSPQVAHPWSAFRRCCCALTQKLPHHQEGQAHTSPLLRSASALQMRRQTGNESCCALVNELITLRRHCQFCFCSAWSQYLSESGCNVRVAARAFQEDMFLDKSKVLEYSSTQLGFSPSLSFFNSVCDILWTFFLAY